MNPRSVCNQHPGAISSPGWNGAGIQNQHRSLCLVHLCSYPKSLAITQLKRAKDTGKVGRINTGLPHTAAQCYVTKTWSSVQ